MNQTQKQQKKLNKNKENFKEIKKDFKENSGQNKLNTKKNFIQMILSDNNKITTVQETIPYKTMYKDGICQVNDTHFNKTIQFSDINYRLAQKEDQDRIFNSYCEFLNYFDSSIDFQLTFLNQTGYADAFIKDVIIEDKDDKYNKIRREYSEMLKTQLSKGNNGLIKSKYITFGVDAKNLKEAIPRLERIESDIRNNFKVLGVGAETLNGEERLDLLNRILNQKTILNNLKVDWNKLKKLKVNTKDLIAPTSFNFSNPKVFKSGNIYGTTNSLMLTSPELTDKMLAEFLDIEDDILINIHIKSEDQRNAIKFVKGRISDLEKMKIEEQKKAIKAGYDMDIIPPDLADYINESKFLLNELQNKNERYFNISIQITNFAKTIEKLENISFQISGIAQKYNCSLKRLVYLQEQGMVNSLPLGVNKLPYQLGRGVPTSALGILIPFTTQELFQSGKSLYYGLNAISNNIIMVDRGRLDNPNGLILGVPGSGKSFSAKREITNSFLIKDGDVIICDPEAEYTPLAMSLGGTIIKLSTTSKDYINPLDINLNYGDGDDPVMLKASFILSLFELITGGTQGLQPVEITLIDRCTRNVYQKYIENPIPENIPILEDLYNELLKQEEKEAKRLATSLEIYVKGSLRVFNNRTNVDVHNRVVCYNIKELKGNLKKIGMLIIQDQVWNRVSANRDKSKETAYYVDEFHLQLKDKQTAEYSVEIWKRFRKWGGIPTGITQNIKDLLASPEIENIFENSEFVILLKQAPGDRKILAEKLNISVNQLSYITNSGAGEGLLKYGSAIVPFIDKFPKDTLLYKLMSTKPGETYNVENLL